MQYLRQSNSDYYHDHTCRDPNLVCHEVVSVGYEDVEAFLGCAQGFPLRALIYGNSARLSIITCFVHLCKIR